MSVAWRLRLVKFGTQRFPGYFVGLSARRTDFELFKYDANDQRNFVFTSEAVATAAGIAVFAAYGRREDVLLPVRGPVGEMLSWKDINQRARSLQAKTPEQWRAFLRTFSPWTISGDPAVPVRDDYHVEVYQDRDGAWKVKDKERAPW